MDDATAQLIPPSRKEYEKLLTEPEKKVFQDLMNVNEDDVKEGLIALNIHFNSLVCHIPGVRGTKQIYHFWLEKIVSRSKGMTMVTSFMFKKIAQCNEFGNLSCEKMGWKSNTSLESKTLFNEWDFQVGKKTPFDTIFVPICNQNHASLAVIYLKSSEIIHYDTSRSYIRDEVTLSVLQSFVEGVYGRPFKANCVASLSAQRNPWDCVFYCLKIAEMIVLMVDKHKIMIKHHAILHYRLDLARLILNKLQCYSLHQS